MRSNGRLPRLSGGGRASGATEHLIDIRLAWEERSAAGHLRQHAANCPDIYRLAVLRVASQKLWAAVPARSNVVGVSSARARERPRKAKVAEFESACRHRGRAI
eukprot:6176068-Pleurochrysis_carterae.AAC.3